MADRGRRRAPRRAARSASTSQPGACPPSRIGVASSGQRAPQPVSSATNERAGIGPCSDSWAATTADVRGEVGVGRDLARARRARPAAGSSPRPAARPACAAALDEVDGRVDVRPPLPDVAVLVHRGSRASSCDWNVDRAPRPGTRGSAGCPGSNACVRSIHATRPQLCEDVLEHRVSIRTRKAKIRVGTRRERSAARPTFATCAPRFSCPPSSPPSSPPSPSPEWPPPPSPAPTAPSSPATNAPDPAKASGGGGPLRPVDSASDCSASEDSVMLGARGPQGPPGPPGTNGQTVSAEPAQVFENNFDGELPGGRLSSLPNSASPLHDRGQRARGHLRRAGPGEHVRHHRDRRPLLVVVARWGVPRSADESSGLSQSHAKRETKCQH